ncbi:MAG: 6-phospho-beta-glucosidase [Actinophytocola sp.]|nr:6-phospho-beta-glucosidase [Actinophytocola sp.]
MRLVILGGGGFRVPLIYRALLEDTSDMHIDVVLADVDAARLDVIGHVLAQLAANVPDAPTVGRTTNLDDALTGADFVFSAIRVGGLAGRVRDEHLPLAENMLGQETVGAGGIRYGLRTIPVARDIARRVAARAPDAWLINFTNPAGMVTEAMADILGDRVIGICDSPAGLSLRVAHALGVEPDTARFDYAGLNHLGWLRAVHVDGRDRLPELLDDDEALGGFEEGRLFGGRWLRALGAIPNEYLHYYYNTAEAIRTIQRQAQTRGEFLRDQQGRFYVEAARDPARALVEWQRARQEREATYMPEARGDEPRNDVVSGGYERVALRLMRALSRDNPTTLILNVRNRSAVPGLDADAVVEVPCTVDREGARPLVPGPIPDDQLGLIHAVKAAERATIDAAVTGSRTAALRAFGLHPLVDSVAAAARIVDNCLG